jgi:hypothetical protein
MAALRHAQQQSIGMVNPAGGLGGDGSAAAEKRQRQGSSNTYQRERTAVSRQCVAPVITETRQLRFRDDCAPVWRRLAEAAASALSLTSCRQAGLMHSKSLLPPRR